MVAEKSKKYVLKTKSEDYPGITKAILDLLDAYDCEISYQQNTVIEGHYFMCSHFESDKSERQIEELRVKIRNAISGNETSTQLFVDEKKQIVILAGKRHYLINAVNKVIKEENLNAKIKLVISEKQKKDMLKTILQKHNLAGEYIDFRSNRNDPIKILETKMKRWKKSLFLNLYFETWIPKEIRGAFIDKIFTINGWDGGESITAIKEAKSYFNNGHLSVQHIMHSMDATSLHRGHKLQESYKPIPQNNCGPEAIERLIMQGEEEVIRQTLITLCNEKYIYHKDRVVFFS